MNERKPWPATLIELDNERLYATTTPPELLVDMTKGLKDTRLLYVPLRDVTSSYSPKLKETTDFNMAVINVDKIVTIYVGDAEYIEIVEEDD